MSVESKLKQVNTIINEKVGAVGFEDLNDYVISNVLSFLSYEDLLNLRIVSNKMKILAEQALKAMKSSITIDCEDVNYNRINFLIRLHPLINKITMRGVMKLSYDTVLRLAKENLPPLETLIIIGSEHLSSVIYSEIVSSIQLHVSNLKELFLACVDIDDNDVSLLLKSMHQLTTFSISPQHIDEINGKMKGTFIKDIGENVKSLKCSYINWDKDVTLNGKGYQIKHFIGMTMNDENSRIISELIERELTNVVCLELAVSLISFDFLRNLHNLKRFIFDSQHLSEPLYFERCFSLKILNLSCLFLSSSEVAYIISLFPFIEELYLYGHGFNFFENVLVCASLLICKSLKLLYWTSIRTATSNKTENLHYFIKTMSILNSVETFAISCSLTLTIKNELHALFRSKPNKKFILIVHKHENLVQSINEPNVSVMILNNDDDLESYFRSISNVQIEL